MPAEPLISVIIPVYKVEKYLRTCVDCVLNQTYKNLEIILVDDGSPDTCPAICDEYAAFDSRVRAIHRQNGGLSAARNTGLDCCHGEYITFVDSDDFIHERCAELLLRACLENDCDIAVAQHLRVDEDSTGEYAHAGIAHFNTECADGRQASFKMFGSAEATNMTTTWGKLYKRSLCFGDEPLRFPEGKIHEDEATTYKLMYRARRVACIDAALYFYRKTSGGIMLGSFGERNFVVFPFYEERIEFYLNLGEEELACAAIEREYSIALKYCRNTLRPERADSPRLRKLLRHYMLRLCKTALPLKGISAKQKLKYLLCLPFMKPASVHLGRKWGID